ncbi:hypothetical protein BC628DRAFT_1398324 [Trametes gibbosa]|nr:hypothetical protein BC628DRAFT_1398324 [Trametes gibbosa]
MATTSRDTAIASSSVGMLDLQDRRLFTIGATSTSPSHENTSTASSPFAQLDAPVGVADSLDLTGKSSPSADLEPDAQILEALRSKDRIYVLKLGEQMEALIKDRRVKFDLTPSTSYQRLLVHRCSAYYKLAPETDPVTKNINIYYRSESRIPTRRICELVPVEESAQPAIQIMRRPRGRQHSHPGSTAGEDADTSDVDASEAGSIGSRSNHASAAAKRFKTIEEREAAYNEARSRIFMGFEEKEKEKDMSANSSTFSLVSGSGSTSGGRGSSIGDLDDSASSAPTESEWSGPVARDKSRKGASSTTSSRSLKSGPSFNGSGSSRNSRATSPSFTYPPFYEPATMHSYDQSSYGPRPPSATGYVSPYGYPAYTSPNGQPYANPYYYPPYSYPPPPSHHPESSAPGVVEPIYHPSNTAQQPAYNSTYIWSNAPPSGQHPVPHQHHQHGQPVVVPGHHDAHAPAHAMQPMQNIPQYAPYVPTPPMYAYGLPAYYAQPYQSGVPMGPPPIPGPTYQPSPAPDHLGTISSNPNGAEFNRTSSRGSNGHGNVNGKRGGPRVRGSWTYGPGVSASGYTYSPSGSTNGAGGNEAYGPRLTSNMRRTSSSGSAGARTPADETASTASSSTTSSSSRRTFTSTSTSSKHPLPARPDWAVGLKPQHPRHHDHHGSANSRTMSPARLGQPHLSQQHQSQPELQSNDFPPLSSGPSTRQPIVGGAWTNASMSRVMMPAPQGTVTQGTALVHYPTSQQSSPQIPTSGARFEEQDRSFERLSPKTAELFSVQGGESLTSSGTSSLDCAATSGEGEGIVEGLCNKLSAMGLDSTGHSLDRIASQGSHVPSAVQGEVQGDVDFVSS